MDRRCPPSFLCPITDEIMVDPVICSDGHSYERSAIEDWLRCHDRSPQTNAPLSNKDLTPNHALRNAIEEWNKKAAKDFKLVPHSAISMGRQIGKGAFKSVYEGQFKGQRVAVLKLRAGSCDTEADVFVRLGRRPGLVQFIGMCCERPEEQLLLTEFAPHGSLLEFLSDDEKAEQLTMEHKLCMLHQVRRRSLMCSLNE